jgi:hypothetical protein
MNKFILTALAALAIAGAGSLKASPLEGYWEGIERANREREQQQIQAENDRRLRDTEREQERIRFEQEQADFRRINQDAKDAIDDAFRFERELTGK